MIIGVDIDDVVLEYAKALNKYVAQKFNLHYNIDQYKSTYYNDVWKMPEKEFWERFKEWEASPEYLQMQPIKDAQTILEQLSKKHTIYFITSRGQNVEQITKDWLQTHFNFKFNIFFAQDPNIVKHKITKAEFCKDNNITIILEDNVKTSLDCANNNIKVILFDKPWNKELKHTLISRVNDWKAAEQVIKIHCQ